MPRRATRSELGKLTTAFMEEVYSKSKNGLIDVQKATQAMYKVGEDEFPQFVRFHEVAGMIKPLHQQLARLRKLNEACWGGFLTEQQLNAADTAAQEQSFSRATHFHVHFESEEETFLQLWKAISFEQMNYNPSLKLEADQRFSWLKLAQKGTAYTPGLHLVTLNLAACWRMVRFNAGDVGSIRSWANGCGERLAHAEILSFYALHPLVLRELNGIHLPFPVLGGYQAVLANDEEAVPKLAFYKGDKPEIRLWLVHPKDSIMHCSVPTVISSRLGRAV